MRRGKTNRYKARRLAISDSIRRVVESPHHGVEVGVWKGDTAEYLLDTFSGLHLTLVDGWTRGCLPFSYRRIAKHCIAKDDEDYDAVYQGVVARFGTRSHRILRMSSLEACSRIYAGSLDFAFIDAGHDFSSVLMDCVAWWRNIRAGGVLVGDDYATRNDRLGVACVHGAVDFFAEKVGAQVVSKDRIWSIVK